MPLFLQGFTIGLAYVALTAVIWGGGLAAQTTL